MTTHMAKYTVESLAITVVISLFAVEGATSPFRLSLRAFLIIMMNNNSSTSAVTSQPMDDMGRELVVHEPMRLSVKISTAISDSEPKRSQPPPRQMSSVAKSRSIDFD